MKEKKNLSEKIFEIDIDTTDEEGKVIKFKGDFYKPKDVKESMVKCFKKMEKRLIGNKIKYQDVILIIKQEFGKELTK